MANGMKLLNEKVRLYRAIYRATCARNIVAPDACDAVETTGMSAEEQ